MRAADAPVETAKYLGHGRCDTHTRLVQWERRLLRKVDHGGTMWTTVLFSLTIRCGRLDPVCGDAEKLVNEARKLMATIKAPVEELRGV